MSGSTTAAHTAPVASASTTQHQQQNQITIEAVIDAITSVQDDVLLAHTLKACSTRDLREIAFASLLDDQRDPLDILDPANNTLGYLYLLPARLSVHSASIPSIQTIQNFCENFNPVKARLAPERVTVLGKAIVSFFERSNSLSDSIPPLSALVSRYPPSPSHLTTLHALFARVCATTRQYAALLPSLSSPITEVDPSISDLHYNDNLIYHYAGGLALAGLKRWSEAEECFEVVVGAPAQVPAAIQFEALKKLALVQLILYGKVKEVPKYVVPPLVSLFKKTPYAAFAREYPLKQAALEQIAEKEAEVFAADKNTGLVQLALGRARRWAIKRLTSTYISLSLTEIGNAVHLTEEQAVRAIVQSMIDEHEIAADISADGTVIFSDVSTPALSSAQIGALLASAQAQGALLASLDKQMERNKDFVSKAWKNTSGGGGGAGSGDFAAAEEDMHMKGTFDTWAEDA